MGAQKSKTQQVTDVINQTSTNVMASISNSAKASIQQANDLTITGVRHSNVSDILQSNEADIDVAIVANSATSGYLQSQLSAALDSELKKNASVIGYSTQDTSITNNIKNIVNNNITAKTVNQAFAGITQSNKLVISDITDSGNVSNIHQTNIGKAISKLMSSTDAQIQSLLGTSEDVKIKDTQTASNPVSDVAATVGNTITGVVSSVTNMIGGNGILFIIIIAVAAYYFREQLMQYKDTAIKLWLQYYPVDLFALIGGVAVLVVVL